MTTDRVLAEILENGLGPAYQEEIRKRYQFDTAEGLFEPEEREYDAKYGFLAGLHCGFKQFFTLNHDPDGGFSKYVSDEIYKMPQMMRHREYYAKIERRNQLAKALEAEVGCKNQYHLVSVACAWEQRSYSASIDGFFLGYHAAVAILGEVDPSSFPGLQMEGNILCMEHQLGFIRNQKE